MAARELTGWMKVVHRLVILGVILAVVVPFYWIGVMSVTPQRCVAGRTIPTMVPR